MKELDQQQAQQVAGARIWPPKRPPVTTMAVGEEGCGGVTTLAIGEEEPIFTTLAIGEEDGGAGAPVKSGGGAFGAF